MRLQHVQLGFRRDCLKIQGKSKGHRMQTMSSPKKLQICLRARCNFVRPAGVAAVATPEPMTLTLEGAHEDSLRVMTVGVTTAMPGILTMRDTLGTGAGVHRAGAAAVAEAVTNTMMTMKTTRVILDVIGAGQAEVAVLASALTETSEVAEAMGISVITGQGVVVMATAETRSMQARAHTMSARDQDVSAGAMMTKTMIVERGESTVTVMTYSVNATEERSEDEDTMREMTGRMSAAGEWGLEGAGADRDVAIAA